MRVLFCVKQDFYDTKGGMFIQITKTREFLLKLGLNCDITTTHRGIKFENYDIIHLTDLTWVYDNIQYLRAINASKFGGKIALSTIYWPLDDYAKNGAPFVQRSIARVFGLDGFERAKALAKGFKNWDYSYLRSVFQPSTKTQQAIIDVADILLPNSEIEMQKLRENFQINKQVYEVVTNAVDPNNLSGSQLLPFEARENAVAFVGRLDPRKNQYNFLRSVYHLDCKIIFIGNPGPNSRSYYRRLRNLAEKRGNVVFYEHLEQSEIFSILGSTKVHALTSWVETPGLVSIEAALCGCNLVLCDKGSVREYFDEYGYYCDPDDLSSIREAVIKALEGPVDESLKFKINRQHTWEVAALQTLEAYKRIMHGLT